MKHIFVKGIFRRLFYLGLICLPFVAVPSKGQNVKASNTVTWLPSNQLNQMNADPVTATMNSFLKSLQASFRPMICQYEGVKLVETKPFKSGSVVERNNTWSCVIKSNTVPEKEGKAIDVKLIFRLNKGEAFATGVAAAFDFNQWKTDNYVLIPASVYNGNRNKIEMRGYCTGFDTADFYNKEIPQITTDLPQLSPLPDVVSK